MASRRSLQATLESILGSRNVYFDPPESIKMKYPCIVYSFSSVKSTYADNIRYKGMNKYMVTYIGDDPDSQTPFTLMNMKYASFDRKFTQSDLHHTVISLYY